MCRPPLHVVIVGNPESPRIDLFQAALLHAGQPAATVLPYLDLIDRRTRLDQVIREGSLLRIESPGRNFEVERALLALGEEVEDDDKPAPVKANRIVPDKGRIWHPRQWYLGFREALRIIDRQREACPEHATANPSAAIATMFDKVACHEHLTQAGIACPRGLGRVRSYQELRSRMADANQERVFIKLAHGSSASGVVAFAASGRRLLAVTSVETVREAGELRLYNSRQVRRIQDEREVAELIDALAGERVHVERWVPKAGIDGRTFDLRVVVIAGRADHIVARMSQGPITNLHLKNRREDPNRIKARMQAEAWNAALQTCERAAATFEGCLHAGIDLAITPRNNHAVLEVNAFGDLLHGVASQGQDTYSAEVAAMMARVTA